MSLTVVEFYELMTLTTIIGIIFKSFQKAWEVETFGKWFSSEIAMSLNLSS